jgi:PAS domain S-box-containing protein/putative nucleotidyltransferase with HDIG domain
MPNRSGETGGKMLQAVEVVPDVVHSTTNDGGSQNPYEAPDNSEALLRLILGLSTNFIILPPDDVDDGISDVLKAIGSFAVVDRSCVFQFRNGGTTMSKTHEWCHKDINGKMANILDLPIDRIPWLTEKIKSYEVVHIPDVLALPGFAKAEKRHFIKEGVRSLVAVPIMSADSALGFIGFESCQPNKVWSENIIALLKIVGEIFAFAISRKQVTDELRQSQSKYRVLFEYANDGILLVRKGEIVDCNSKIVSMFNKDRSQIIGCSSINVSCPKVAEKYLRKEMAKREKLALSGKPQSFEWKYCMNNGDLFDAEVSLNRVAVGDEVFLQAVIRDITDRKRSEEKLEHTLQNLQKTMAGTIQVIAHVVETRDAYTAGHQRRVADLASAIAVEMNLSPDMIEGIRMAGVIHDIGKISVPAEILSKPGELRQKEFELIKDHPETGYDILKDVEFPWPIADIILQHHERMNGSGYPKGLTKDQILLEARIIALSDVVEAIASHRPYRPARGIDAALEEIEKNRGKLYDENVVDVCLILFNEKGYKFF